jgi:integration host factor subunit alpha
MADERLPWDGSTRRVAPALEGRTEVSICIIDRAKEYRSPEVSGQSRCHEACPAFGIAPILPADTIYRNGQVAMTKPTRRSKTAVTRAGLCEAIYKTVGLSQSESARLVELVLDEITNCLEHGETVKLSSFDYFVVRSKGARMGPNPKTGVPAPIPPLRAAVFKPSDVLRKRLADQTTND